VLVEAAQSPDDRVRMKSAQQLGAVCNTLLTDGSTSAVELLSEFYRDACARNDGHLITVLGNAMGWVNHNQTFWVTRWLQAVGQEEGHAQELARHGLNAMGQVSPAVLSILCATLNDPTRPTTVRRAIAGTIVQILRRTSNQLTNAAIHAALT